MADQGKKITDFHQAHFDSLSESLGSYHEALEELNAEEIRLQQRRAIIKATALSELAQVSGVKLSNEAIGVLAAACW